MRARLQAALVGAEQTVDAWRSRAVRRTGAPLCVVSYGGHGGPDGVVVRGRVLANPPPTAAVEGEGLVAAVRRSVGHFRTVELPGVPLRVTVGGASTDVVSDEDGYFLARLPAAGLASPWTEGRVEVTGPDAGPAARVGVRVPGEEAAFGVISDVDDTIVETGVQRVGTMLRNTFTRSALTRTPFPGVAELYRDLAADGANPFFYISSSPWNLHDFLVAFLRHRDFPLGPLLLRDLLGTRQGRARKHERIEEVLALHPGLRFVLVGDSGEHDPEVYADVVRAHPGRVLAVYIREVRLDPGDGRVERVSEAWDADAPFVLAADSDAVRRHAAGIGLLRR
jgi:phosphatidate phosphatase APP1